MECTAYTQQFPPLHANVATASAHTGCQDTRGEIVNAQTAQTLRSQRNSRSPVQQECHAERCAYSYTQQHLHRCKEITPQALSVLLEGENLAIMKSFILG